MGSHRSEWKDVGDNDTYDFVLPHGVEPKNKSATDVVGELTAPKDHMVSARCVKLNSAFSMNKVHSVLIC